MRFKVGDRVIENGMGHGTVMAVYDRKGNYAIEFDKNIGGHDCNGLTKGGHGWYCLERDLTSTNPTIGNSRLEFKWV